MPEHLASTLRAEARAILSRGAWAIEPGALQRLQAIAAGSLVVPASAEVERPAAEARVGRLQVRGGVAVVNLTGIITPQGSLFARLFGMGPGGLVGFRQEFREALGSDDVSAIVLNVDSPGGLVDLVPETAAEVRAARGTKPVVAVANTMAASAAYWIAAQADELVVTPSGELGSIGVFRAHEDYSGFDQALGIVTTLVSAGRYKTEGNPYGPLGDEAQAAWQADVDDLYGRFVEDVAAGRGVAASAVRTGYGEGRVLGASRAVTAGLGDRVESIEQTIVALTRGGAPAPRRSAAAPSSTSPEADPTVAARIAELGALQPPIPPV